MTRLRMNILSVIYSMIGFGASIASFFIVDHLLKLFCLVVAAVYLPFSLKFLASYIGDLKKSKMDTGF